jgi:hypothetical protein
MSVAYYNLMDRFETAETEEYVQGMHILISVGEENPPIKTWYI